MPQVAARITDEVEKRLQHQFKTKSAGAEFLLPWVAETFARCMTKLKHEFSVNELKTFVAAYKRTTRLLPESCRLAYLKVRMREACNEEFVNTDFGTSWPALERKLERLDDTHAAALMVWSAAYWTSPRLAEVSLDDYVHPETGA